ncbi:hypothetical protein IAQ61_001643 [Plenodomus lingam]|uniref:uncharacterized protein n=1 Tax=Leptosphaeria maculans TaxID=5022 RepID=UPI003326AB72|nr:hypothetical protein IAQ61_001643 [Plenodomus lingam]
MGVYAAPDSPDLRFMDSMTKKPSSVPKDQLHVPSIPSSVYMTQEATRRFYSKVIVAQVIAKNESFRQRSIHLQAHRLRPAKVFGFLPPSGPRSFSRAIVSAWPSIIQHRHFEHSVAT